MTKLTQWQHFKENYIGTSIFLIALFVLILTLEIARGNDSWWFSFIFLALCIVVIPLGNYVSWKKKYK